MTPKFKVGEMVRCIDSKTGLIQNAIGVIVSITESGRYYVNFKEHNITPSLSEERIEALTPLEQLL